MANDVVNHPSHYTQGKIECIDFITDKKMNFCRGNAVKYIVRAGLKDKSKEIEDLEKAIFYLRREIKDLQEAENSDTAPGIVNLEKVIKGLDLCTNGENFPPCKDCPYDAECEKTIGTRQSPLVRDALALLKEHGSADTIFAEMTLVNGDSMFVNTKYITAYRYLKDRDETAVALLSENAPIYFPGDQTVKITRGIK